MRVQDAMIESVRPECLALSGLDTREAGPRMQVSPPSRTKDRRERAEFREEKCGYIMNS